MRKAAFLALTMLAAPFAWAQSNVLPPNASKAVLPDPHPIAVPVFTPAMATAAVATVTPALGSVQVDRKGCSALNPCATVTPAMQSVSLPEPEAEKGASPQPKNTIAGAASANGPCPPVSPAGAVAPSTQRSGGRGGNGGAPRGGFGGRGEERFARRGESAGGRGGSGGLPERGRDGNAPGGRAGVAIHCPPAAPAEAGAASPQNRPASNAAESNRDGQAQDRRSGRRGDRNSQGVGRDQ